MTLLQTLVDGANATYIPNWFLGVIVTFILSIVILIAKVIWNNTSVIRDIKELLAVQIQKSDDKEKDCVKTHVEVEKKINKHETQIHTHDNLINEHDKRITNTERKLKIKPQAV